MKIISIGPESTTKPGKEEIKKAEEKKEVKKEETTSKPSTDNFWTGSLRVVLSIILSVGAYFTVRHFLPQGFSPVLIEFASFIISLLVLKAISIAYGGRDNKVGSAVFVLMLVIFVWQMLHLRADYEPATKSSGQGGRTVEIMTLYPRTEPYIFHLKEVGDESLQFKPPTGGLHSLLYSSHDFGYEIIFNDGTIYQGDPSLEMPEKFHPVIKIRATKPNQYVNIVVKKR